MPLQPDVTYISIWAREKDFSLMFLFSWLQHTFQISTCAKEKCFFSLSSWLMKFQLMFAICAPTWSILLKNSICWIKIIFDCPATNVQFVSWWFWFCVRRILWKSSCPNRHGYSHICKMMNTHFKCCHFNQGWGWKEYLDVRMESQHCFLCAPLALFLQSGKLISINFLKTFSKFAN